VPAWSSLPTSVERQRHASLGRTSPWPCRNPARRCEDHRAWVLRRADGEVPYAGREGRTPLSAGRTAGLVAARWPVTGRMAAHGFATERGARLGFATYPAGTSAVRRQQARNTGSHRVDTRNDARYLARSAQRPFRPAADFASTHGSGPEGPAFMLRRRTRASTLEEAAPPRPLPRSSVRTEPSPRRHRRSLRTAQGAKSQCRLTVM
jgi:hypothetical protein